MHKRHPDNTHLKLHYGPYWNGLPVQTESGPLIDNYLLGINNTLCHATKEFTRTSVFRFDLHFPVYWPEDDTAVISRFFQALTKKLEGVQRQATYEGKRVAPNRLRYVWAKEHKDAKSWHYHVAIMLNRDAFFTLGRLPNLKDLYSPSWDSDVGSNMAERIVLAWANALYISPDLLAGSVYFPKNCVYEYNGNSLEANQQFEDVFYRLSYLAKVDTKGYGTRANNFGCSRK